VKLDPRFLLPAALLAGALALPASGAADPPATGACPDHYMGPFPIAIFSPAKDHNGDGQLCVKENNMGLVFKDDNCNPHCDQSDLIDPLQAWQLPSDTLLDNDVLP
jgi:hypothetical protein